AGGQARAAAPRSCNRGARGRGLPARGRTSPSEESCQSRNCATFPRGQVLLRRVLSAVLLAGVFAAPANASSQTLIPGLTYSRQLLFTPHGPVVVHVLVAPRPGGLWGLHPVLSDNAISGKQRRTGIERLASPSATVAGINGDFFNAPDGRPDGIVM